MVTLFVLALLAGWMDGWMDDGGFGDGDAGARESVFRVGNGWSESLHAVEFVNDVAELVLHVTDAVCLEFIVSRGSRHDAFDDGVWGRDCDWLGAPNLQDGRVLYLKKKKIMSALFNDSLKTNSEQLTEPQFRGGGHFEGR